MRVRILPSSPAAPATRQFLTSFLVDDVVAFDAGCLGLYGRPEDQSRVRDVFLTHSHADHVGTLPVFVENAYESRADCPVVRGHPATLDSLRRDVFNDRVWPDFLSFPDDQPPFLRLETLEPERVVEVAGLRVTAVALHHTVPTYAYLVEDEDGTVVIGGDTGPTTRLWELARRSENLKAVFLEASFPDEQAELARVSGHLTPQSFAAELEKLGRPVPAIAVHIKPRGRERTVEQLLALELPRLAIGEGGREYTL